MKNSEIIQYIEYSEELKTLVIDIINLKNGGQQFSNVLTFAGYTEEQKRKIDSAYPSPYADQIREIYPDFRNGLHCYDYNTATFGEMRNVNNLIAKRILKRF